MDYWKFRKLGRIAPLRRVVKWAFSVIYWDGRIINIKRGPLKNLKWKCHKDHQFWMPLGLYESETAKWLETQIEDGMTFIDIGANAGYFTLLGSRCVAGGGRLSHSNLCLSITI